MSEEHIEVTEAPKVIPLSDLPVVQKYQPPNHQDRLRLQ